MFNVITRRLALLIAFLVLTIWSGPVLAASAPPLSASAAILVDGQTGQILFGRDIYGEFYPASITKIMTAYLAITHGWNRTVVVSRAAQDQIGSSAYLVAGERLSMPKVVTAMMMVSGNDAAYAVAQTVAGSVPAFVRMMNAQARAWKAPGIHFDNPDGLPCPKHVVSALGMAIIAEHAMENPIFAAIVRTQESTLPPDPEPRIYYNQNQLLNNFPGAVGIKIGYTIEADETIVGAARRHGILLIDVLLHDTPAGLWPDAENLLSWGFQNFRQITLVSKNTKLGHVMMGRREIFVRSATQSTYLVRRGSHQAVRFRLLALHPHQNTVVPRGSIIGKADILLGGQLAAEVPLISAHRVPSLPPTIHHTWWWLLLPGLVIVFALWRPGPNIKRLRSKGEQT